jgi:hypothetical protein
MLNEKDKTHLEANAADKLFDQLLQKKLSIHYEHLDDNGFTESVIQKISAEKSLSLSLLTLVPFIVSALITIVILSQLPWLNAINSVYGFLLTLNLVELIQLGFCFFLFALISTGILFFRVRD